MKKTKRKLDRWRRCRWCLNSTEGLVDGEFTCVLGIEDISNCHHFTSMAKWNDRMGFCEEHDILHARFGSEYFLLPPSEMGRGMCRCRWFLPEMSGPIDESEYETPEAWKEPSIDELKADQKELDELLSNGQIEREVYQREWKQLEEQIKAVCEEREQAGRHAESQAEEDMDD